MTTYLPSGGIQNSEEDELFPIFTNSYTSGDWSVFANSEDSRYPAYFAFDRTTMFWSNDYVHDSLPVWIGIACGVPTALSKLTIQFEGPVNGEIYYVASQFIIQGSMDGNTWDALTNPISDWFDPESHRTDNFIYLTINLDNNKFWNYYRVYIYEVTNNRVYISNFYGTGATADSLIDCTSLLSRNTLFYIKY